MVDGQLVKLIHTQVRCYDTDILPMIKKTVEKEYAIRLRKEGKTYSDILRIVQVAKSTLGLWLKEANLSKAENQKFNRAWPASPGCGPHPWRHTALHQRG